MIKPEKISEQNKETWEKHISEIAPLANEINKALK
jgi:hypothetical protein